MEEGDNSGLDGLLIQPIEIINQQPQRIGIEIPMMDIKIPEPKVVERSGPVVNYSVDHSYDGGLVDHSYVGTQIY